MVTDKIYFIRTCIRTVTGDSSIIFAILISNKGEAKCVPLFPSAFDGYVKDTPRMLVFINNDYNAVRETFTAVFWQSLALLMVQGHNSRDRPTI